MVPDFAKTILHVDTVSSFRGLKMKIQLKLKYMGFQGWLGVQPANLDGLEPSPVEVEPA
jgi:hypothetical protein